MTELTNAINQASYAVKHMLAMLCARLDIRVVSLTIAMEMVANANGSPTMCPKLNLRPPPWLYLFSILRSDGEPEPYDGMKLG
jgi:hypothetical protein